MAVTSWIRRQFKDGVITTATTTMTNAATTFSVGSGQGVSFPDGSVGPFIVTVDQGQAAEEKILVQSRSGDTFTVATNGRGYNGTTAQAHTGATVLHTIDAQDFDEANQVVVQTLGAVTASGDLLQGSGANALSRLARGTSGQVLQAGASLLSWVGFGVGQSQAVGSANADGTQTTMCHPDHVHAGVTSFATRQGAVVAGNADYLAVASGGLTGATTATRYVGGTASGAPASGTFAVGDFVIDQTGVVWVCTSAGTPGTWNQVGLASAAWTTYTPTWTSNGGGNPALGNGSVFGSYVQQGKLVTVHIQLKTGTTSTFGSGTLQLSLPVNAAVTHPQSLLGWLYDGTTNYPALGLLNAGGQVQMFTTKGGTGGGMVAYGVAQATATDQFNFQGPYEAF